MIEPEDELAAEDVVLLVELVGTNFTASADVIHPPLDVVITFALSLKLYVPNLFQIPPFFCWLTVTVSK
jgi:hypothetical protein